MTETDTVLLVHGHPFDHTMWSPQIDSLEARGIQAIAPDLRGYGTSAVTEGQVGLDVFAGDLLDLLTERGVGAAVVVGLSMGGQIAMEIARQAPERVRGLLIAASFAEAETDEGKARRNAMADRLLREGMQGYADEVLSSMVGETTLASRPEIGRLVHGMMTRTDPRGAAAALRGRAERPDYRPTLASLDVPTTIVVGDADAFTSRAQADELVRTARDAELVWLEGVGHMPNLEATTAFDDALDRLMARVAARN